MFQFFVLSSIFLVSIEARLFTDFSLPTLRQSVCKLIISFVCPADLTYSTYQTISEDIGEPLILTELLAKGDDVAARKLARVDSKHFLNVTSYSG